MSEVYVSTDVEADGPIPGPHSLLSLGSAAYRADNTLIDTFAANLETLEGAAPHPDTMAFWAKHPDAWAAARTGAAPPQEVMPRYAAWLDALPGPPVFVGYPAAYDFQFVYWYLMRFAGRSPFGFAALDIKTLAMAALGTDFRKTAKRTMPARWFDDRPHTHVALDDAIEQGALFCNILAELRP
ncbi:MAG: exonuclease [Myxococcota bacterium]